MTPEEKAKELVDKMYGVTDYQCKQSAIVAVDEIIDNYEEKYKYCTTKIYWEEVKQEIENL